MMMTILNALLLLAAFEYAEGHAKLNFPVPWGGSAPYNTNKPCAGKAAQTSPVAYLVPGQAFPIEWQLVAADGNGHLIIGLDLSGGTVFSSSNPNYVELFRTETYGTFPGTGLTDLKTYNNFTGAPVLYPFLIPASATSNPDILKNGALNQNITMRVATKTDSWFACATIAISTTGMPSKQPTPYPTKSPTPPTTLKPTMIPTSPTNPTSMPSKVPTMTPATPTPAVPTTSRPSMANSNPNCVKAVGLSYCDAINGMQIVIPAGQTAATAPKAFIDDDAALAIQAIKNLNNTKVFIDGMNPECEAHYKRAKCALNFPACGALNNAAFPDSPYVCKTACTNVVRVCQLNTDPDVGHLALWDCENSISSGIQFSETVEDSIGQCSKIVPVLTDHPTIQPGYPTTPPPSIFGEANSADTLGSSYMIFALLTAIMLR